MTKEEFKLFVIKESLNKHIDSFTLPEGCAPVDISGIKDLIKSANYTEISLNAIYNYMLMIEQNIFLATIVINKMGDAFKAALSSVGFSDTDAGFAANIWKLILADFITEAFNLNDDALD